ncbi:Alpha-1,3-mannosyltransferase cmt1 [Trifolium repens]|nr:Alpha-1,3-mannosyltransferase cmt1 [Trifolium repens]
MLDDIIFVAKGGLIASHNPVINVKIVQVSPTVDFAEKKKKMPSCELYYDMKSTIPYLTFSNIDNDIIVVNGESSQSNGSEKSEWSLLDLYSRCGPMSTGLCFGASISGIKLVTRWAVDINQYACESLKLNHPETQVMIFGCYIM